MRALYSIEHAVCDLQNTIRDFALLASTVLYLTIEPPEVGTPILRPPFLA
jgi:hypothetical protein